MVEDTVPRNTDGARPEDMDSVADRLEVALGRIAAHLETVKPDRPPGELTARLDGLIGRLRNALRNLPGQSRE